MADKSKTKAAQPKFTTPVFRLSFPNLWTARKSSDEPGAVAKFGCTAIWTPDKFTPREKELWRLIIGALSAESQKVFGKAWKDLDPSTYRKGIRDGASKAIEGYGPGTRFANLTTKNRPGVAGATIDPNTNKLLVISPEEGNADEIYPGCFCRATVGVYSFTKKGKGVALGLRNLQKIKDGPRLDNRTAPEDDFDEDVDSAWLEQDDDIDSGDNAEDDFG